MKQESFYADGLRFSCTRCSACCRYESGFVFLSKKDLTLLARELDMGYNEFTETYCRWVPWYEADGEEGDFERLSLKEKSNFDCIFWKGGCSVYAARPLQCRSFPFWSSILASRGAWDIAASGCPGMNRGDLHGYQEIEARLGERSAEPFVVRKAQVLRGI
jgi:Fe-S-cluster containining protein